MRHSFSFVVLGIVLQAAVCVPLFAGDLLTAEFSDDLSRANVELCFDGAAPARLYRNNLSNGDIFYRQQPISIRQYDGSIRLPDLPDDSCLQWQVDLDAFRGDRNNRSLMKTGNDLVMTADVWFWQGPQGRDLKIHVELPQGLSFSTPWKLLNQRADTHIYQPDNTPSGWEAKIAIGQFDIKPVEIPGAVLRLAMPGKLTASQQQKLEAWIQESATSVSLVSGSFPQPNPQVLIVHSDRNGQADRFGQVLRGGGVAATFYVNANRSFEEFSDGWTATHEFSHMLLPYISSRDRWLSEGLASYYQNTLRARDNRISPTQAWQRLYDGFERGRKATSGGTLAEATRQGRSATMRIYWSGAALMLMADMQLREQSNNRQSLDTALTLLAECCLTNGKTWRAREMFEKLDSLMGSHIFAGLYATYVNSENFPDLQPSWDLLGIEIRNDRVTLKKSAALANVRKAIMKE